MELTIRDVSKTYSNGVQALKNVTLTIPKGMYGLLGPNGAGKFTLMRMIATLDLYRELQAVTPDTLQYLLHDLFAANTFWELKTDHATAKQTAAGSWQVTLELEKRKVVVDTAGRETEVPMNDWVQVGVFAPTGKGTEFGETLYLQKHRLTSGKQTITVTVPRKPADAGIDPYHLLIDLERFDNVEPVKMEQ